MVLSKSDYCWNGDDRQNLRATVVTRAQRPTREKWINERPAAATMWGILIIIARTRGLTIDDDDEPTPLHIAHRRSSRDPVRRWRLRSRRAVLIRFSTVVWSTWLCYRLSVFRDRTWSRVVPRRAGGMDIRHSLLLYDF